MDALIALALVVTMYSDVGPLYCGGHTEGMSEPWIAAPVKALESGAIQCGDLVYLRFEDGSTLMARVRDAGPLSEYCVMDGQECLPILFDVPERWAPFPGLSVGVTHWQNITAAVRELG